MAEAGKRPKMSVKARKQEKETFRRRDKTRVNIGISFTPWCELRDAKQLKTDVELAGFLLDKFSKDRRVAETTYTTPRTYWTSSDESTCSASETENYQNGASVRLQNGQTTDERRKASSQEGEGSCDLSESVYVSLNKEVLVTLMFRCFECSSECRVRGKGNGGNLLLRQECLICCNYRLWTSQSDQSMKEEVSNSPVTGVACDEHRGLSTERISQNENSVRQEDRVDLNAVQEETQVTGGTITSFLVKEEKEDDVEREVESLLMETFVDQGPLCPVLSNGHSNVTSETQDRVEHPHASLTVQVKVFPDNHEEEEEEQQDDSEEDSKTDSSEEEPCEKDLDLFCHKLIQSTVKPIYWCLDCGATVRMPCQIQRHKKIFGCPACGDGDTVEGCSSDDFSVHFSDKESFHKHAIEMHGAKEVPNERTVCPDCKKTFRVQSDPSKPGHVCKYKIKPFSCNLCPKRFATEVGQKVHYRRLHKDYTHLCKFCMTVFDSRASKLDHEQEHSEDELPFLCPDCPEQFKDYITRNEHLKSHRGQKTYPCHKCDRILTSLNHYERHMLTHSGEKPHRCEVCDRSFNQAGNLKSHMRLHTGERPFMCEQCGECFNHNVSLKNHLVRRHHVKSASVSGDENKPKGRPVRNAVRKAQRKKRVRRSSSSSSSPAADDDDNDEDMDLEFELEKELQQNLDCSEESQEPDSDGEKQKRPPLRRTATRRKPKQTK
uniref:C2H2-type domain-containing protein n=2 Tax=Astyanax mexicanus TaxID=7994 RepID=A0A3B1JIS3_ASTMX